MSIHDDECKECRECKKNIACFDIRYGDRTDRCADFEPKERENDRRAEDSR